MINKQLSNKIKIASFLCTIMVLYRHSLNYLAFFNSWTGIGISKRIEDMMSILTEIAVPFFFIISGYFFLNHSYYTKNAYKSMLIKKIKTLVLPFFIWNIVGAFFLLAIDPTKIGNSITSCLMNILQSKWYGPLWYVRDLIIMMFFIPLYNWIFIYNRKWLYLIVWISTFFIWQPVSSSVLSSEGIFFFLIGGIISKYDNVLSVKIPTKSLFLIWAIWISTSVTIMSSTNIYLHKLNILIGIIVFWSTIDYLNKTINRKLLLYAEFTFFLYVMHAYIMKAIKQGIGALFFGNDIAALITYITLPLLTITIICYLGKFWKALSPKSYKIAIGGR